MNKKYIVYGLGKIGQLMVRQLKDTRNDIILILDKTHAGDVYGGIKVLSPDTFDFAPVRDIPVIIALQSPEANAEVLNFLGARGVKKLYPYYMSEPQISEICREEMPLSQKCVHCAFVDSCKKFAARNVHGLGEVKFINQLNFMLTTSCTLNCMCCAAMVDEARQKRVAQAIRKAEIEKYLKKITPPPSIYNKYCFPAVNRH